jgi:hypothetical protein
MLAVRELAGIVTLTGAATMEGSALEISTVVSVVAMLEMVTVTVAVVATLKEGVDVVSAESEIAGDVMVSGRLSGAYLFDLVTGKKPLA